MKIVIATNNLHKLEEYRSLFARTHFEVLSLNDIGIKVEIEESGKTYEENARIKASAVAKLTNSLVIADDSGIEIDELDNFPGLNSSRFAAQYVSQDEANMAILKMLESRTKRQARFICVIAVANYKEQIKLFRGECPGKILNKAEGGNGFGYDPIFYSDEAQECFATLTGEQKNEHSHRGKAVVKVLSFFKEEKII